MKPQSLLLSLTMFTAIPLRTQTLHIDRALARRALLWLPFVGAALGALAAIPLVLAQLTGAGGLLGAVLAVAALAVLTRGLHLDGLADTVDGLGSRAPAERALEIMRQPDVGAFGVAALVLTQLTRVGALAAITPLRTAAAAVILAELTGRVGIALAAGAKVPSARPSGFGALVAGTMSAGARIALVAATLLVAAVPLAWGDARLLVGAVLGLAVAVWWRRRVVKRLGGVTGDVFGSITELASTAVLVGVALS